MLVASKRAGKLSNSFVGFGFQSRMDKNSGFLPRLTDISAFISDSDLQPHKSNNNNGMMATEPKRYLNPLFHEDKFHQQYDRWKDAVGEETLEEEGISRDTMLMVCNIICTKFPRGLACGSLLWEPIVDDTPLEYRGVSLKWLWKAYDWMNKSLKPLSNVLPTRLFVSFFVEPLVLQRPEGGALPLYYFVPTQYRGRPQVFLSHGWDSWLRHLFFMPQTSVAGKLAKKRNKENTFLWLDIFAIVQDPGSEKQQSEVAQIGGVVRSIGRTCLVIPGHGSLRFALLPARRSWCCLEIAYTQQLSARVGLKKDYSDTGKKFHRSLISEIGQLKCTDAETSNENEQKAIQDLLDQELGLESADSMIQRAILRAFYERYSASPLATIYEEAQRETPYV